MRPEKTSRRFFFWRRQRLLPMAQRAGKHKQPLTTLCQVTFFTNGEYPADPLKNLILIGFVTFFTRLPAFCHFIGMADSGILG
jgi:hypothetical protein